MDLLKEEKSLVEKKKKADENLRRKQRYFHNAGISLRKAEKEVKRAIKRLRNIRGKIKAQSYVFIENDVEDLPTDPVVIHTPSVKPTPVEENTD